MEIFDFLTERITRIDTSLDGSAALEDHAGGDAGMFYAYLDALQHGRPELILSGFESGLEGHRVVFAAERARRTGTVIDL